METKKVIRKEIFRRRKEADPIGEYCKRRIPKDLSEYQYLGNLSESTKLFLLLSPWERSFFIAFF